VCSRVKNSLDLARAMGSSGMVGNTLSGSRTDGMGAKPGMPVETFLRGGA